MVSNKPTTLTHVEAASVPVIAVTAWQALFDHAQLEAGQTVVIHGAAGNVGSYAVQLARRAGVQTIATVATDDISFIRNLGANTVIDYRTQRFEEEVEKRALSLIWSAAKHRTAGSRSFVEAASFFGGVKSGSETCRTLWRRSHLLSGQRHEPVSGGDRSPSRWWKTTNKRGGSLTPRECARGSFHAGTRAASAEGKDRARRRSELIDQACSLCSRAWMRAAKPHSCS
jgi:hypothetical protein